jgi:hypothetical protein
MRMARTLAFAAAVGAFWSAAPAQAQPIGTYSWQLQPYCNLLTIAVVQQGGQYQLDGRDDLCGEPAGATLVGLAIRNPNGSIGLGMTIVTSHGGTPVHVYATLSIATLSGTWRDNAGNTGPFTFTPGARVPGTPRPIPTGGLAPGSITNVEIAAGTIGVAQVNTDQIQTRVAGACANGQAIASVSPNGSVACIPSQDVGGPSKRGLFDITQIPATADSFGNAVAFDALVFIAPITGRAIVSGTGYCEGTSLTTGPTSTVLFLGQPSDQFQRFYASINRLPQEASVQTHQWPWTVQRDLDIVAGNTYTVALKAYHAEGAAAATGCAGSVYIRVHAGVLPGS